MGTCVCAQRSKETPVQFGLFSDDEGDLKPDLLGQQNWESHQELYLVKKRKHKKRRRRKRGGGSRIGSTNAGAATKRKHPLGKNTVNGVFNVRNTCWKAGGSRNSKSPVSEQREAKKQIAESQDKHFYEAHGFNTADIHYLKQNLRGNSAEKWIRTFRDSETWTRYQYENNYQDEVLYFVDLVVQEKDASKADRLMALTNRAM